MTKDKPKGCTSDASQILLQTTYTEDTEGVGRRVKREGGGLGGWKFEFLKFD